MVEIRQTETYRKWFDSLRDKKAREITRGLEAQNEKSKNQ